MGTIKGISFYILGSLLLLVINVIGVLRPYFAGTPEALEDVQEYSGLLFNVNSSNQEVERIVDYVRTSDFEFLGILEINQRILDALRPPLQSMGYQYELLRIRKDNFGIALFSRIPLENTKIVFSRDLRLPSLVTDMRIGNKALKLIVSHPIPPMNSRKNAARDSQLAELARIALASREEPVILMMDMNSSPWSPSFKRFEDESGLFDSRSGFGVHITWPTFAPFLGIPIDHVFANEHVIFTDRQVGPDLGSDHYPVAYKFLVK